MAVCESCQIDFEKATSQICQLFEPKPDESRLLKVQEEFLNTPNRNMGLLELLEHVVGKQDAKTASIKDKEIRELGFNSLSEFIIAKDAECQTRVERIFKEIDSVLGEFSDSEDYDLVSEHWRNRLYDFRQALKKQEGLR